jgi:hypothetical protein
MEGLYWYNDADGITFLFFYKDGRVMSYNKYNRFDQHINSFPGLSVESEKVHRFRGIYQVDLWDNIRIVIKGDLGKMEYKGFIRDEDTVDLFCRCPFTWAKKSGTFVRCSLRKDLIHMELGDDVELWSN